MSPKLIKGGRVFDNRGSLTFNNDLNFNEIKRFYIVHNFSANFIRAWHGHLSESKVIKCIKGTFQVSAVKLDDVNKPNKNNEVKNFFLNENDQDYLFIPPGYANGSMSLETNSKLLIFSNSKLEDSIKDDYRFDYDYWNPWEIQSR